MNEPAKLPTEAGLFGEVDRAPRGRRAGAPVRVSSPTLFDLRERDLPGQLTIEDVAEGLSATAADARECSPGCHLCADGDDDTNTHGAHRPGDN